MRKSIALAVATGAILALVAGCTGGNKDDKKPAPAASDNVSSSDGKPAEKPKLSGEIAFQTWSLKNDKFTPYFEKLVKDFESANPGTKINWIDQPGEGYEAKILQQAESGQLPDVVNLPPDFAYQLAQPGVEKVLDLAKADPKVLAEYVPGGLEAYKYDGIEGTYGYPWYLGTDLNWWNTKALKDAGLDPSKLPNSFDELITAAEQMAKATGGKMPMISSMPGLDALAAAGSPIFKDGKFVFATDNSIKLIETYAKLYKEGAMPAEVLTNDYAGNAKMYIQEKVAWTTAGSGFPGELKTNAPSLVDVTKATPRFGNPPLFVQGISVAADSKNPALALAFAQFATNNDNQVAFVKIAQGFMPGTAKGNAEPDSFASAIENPLQVDAVKLAAAQMSKAKIPNPVQFSNDMDTNFKQQISLAIKGDMSAKDALEKAQQYCNDNLVKK